MEIAKQQSRTQFIVNIKQWNHIDTQLKLVNEKTRKIREVKNQLTDEICEYMNTNNHKSIKLSDGEIRLYPKKEYESLSFGYVEECLNNILEDDTQIDFIMDYLRNHREITTSSEIRKFTKMEKHVV